MQYVAELKNYIVDRWTTLFFSPFSAIKSFSIFYEICIFRNGTLHVPQKMYLKRPSTIYYPQFNDEIVGNFVE